MRAVALRWTLSFAVALLFLTLFSQSSRTFADEPAPDGASPSANNAASDEDASSESDVRVNDILKFGQTKVALQMAELEERMFRLADALKELEPENSSRLLLGLKYAREELILQQMK